MYIIDVGKNIVRESNDEVNWNQAFNKIQPNLLDFDYEKN